MTSPFATPAMHALKRRIIRAQADALEALGPKPTPRPMQGEQPAVVRVAPAVGKPFDTAAMAALKRRARRRVDLASVANAWRGNEGALPEQIAAGDDIAGLIEDMEKEA